MRKSNMKRQKWTGAEICKALMASRKPDDDCGFRLEGAIDILDDAIHGDPDHEGRQCRLMLELQALSFGPKVPVHNEYKKTASTAVESIYFIRVLAGVYGWPRVGAEADKFIEHKMSTKEIGQLPTNLWSAWSLDNAEMVHG